MIQERISADIKTAMLEKDNVKKDLLRVVLAEIVRYNKTSTDEEAVKTIKKCIENAKTCNNLDEIPILEAYLPKQLTDEEIVGMLFPVYAGHGIEKTNVGELMKVAKEVLGKDFDGKRVSAILKSM